MSNVEDKLPKQQQAKETYPRCPICAAFPRLMLKFLDPKSGKVIRLHQCECGERIWDD